MWLVPCIIELKPYVQPQLLQQDNHLYRALTVYKYPAWGLNRIKIKTKNPAKNNNRSNTTDSGRNNNQNQYMIVPYCKGLTESLKKVCSKHGVQVYFKGGKQIQVWQGGVWWRVYWRIFMNIWREVQRTLKGPFPIIYDHSNITGHSVTIDNFSIVGREDQNLIRTIKEALYIRINNPSLNINIGKYICHIYGMRLCLTPQNSD